MKLFNPKSIVEPSCGGGAFLNESQKQYPNSKITVYEINDNFVSSNDKFKNITVI